MRFDHVSNNELIELLQNIVGVYDAYRVYRMGELTSDEFLAIDDIYVTIKNEVRARNLVERLSASGIDI